MNHIGNRKKLNQNHIEEAVFPGWDRFSRDPEELSSFAKLDHYSRYNTSHIFHLFPNTFLDLIKVVGDVSEENIYIIISGERIGATIASNLRNVEMLVKQFDFSHRNQVVGHRFFPEIRYTIFSLPTSSIEPDIASRLTEGIHVGRSPLASPMLSFSWELLIDSSENRDQVDRAIERVLGCLVSGLVQSLLIDSDLQTISVMDRDKAEGKDISVPL